MRRMLINGKNAEEVRVAIVDGEHLDGFQVALAEGGLTRGNVYRGIVANMVPTLNAAFVEFGEERQGFLAFHDVVPQGWHRKGVANWHPHRIDEILERGRAVLVQVTKDAAGSKGAALTTNISLAGRYLVFTPFDATIGVSRKVEDDEVRRTLRGAVESLSVTEGAGVIVRTAALDQSKTALTRDLAALERLWKRIREEAAKGSGPRQLYTDQDLVVQALRDHLDTSIAEVVVDDAGAFEKAKAYMRAFMPRAKTTLVSYEDRMPLFSRYGLEAAIDAIAQRTVVMPSGATLVIDHTEALTAIDVNSARAKGGGSQDDLIARVNLDAAREVARQLRLRDIGGLIVVDFIDMRSSKHEREVERTLKEAMKADKARSTVGKISPNGLLEINRQRLKQSLEVRTRRVCPTCSGLGTLSSPELVGLRLLRRIQTEAAGGGLKAVRIELHPELADSLQNSRRQDIAAIEREFELRVEIVAASSLHRSEERIEWTRREPGDLRHAAPVGAAVTAADAAQAVTEGDRSGGAMAIPAPEPEREADFGEGNDDAGGKKRRRRRGGRRHKTGELAAVETFIVEMPAATFLPASEVATDGASGETKRKRRRGGRRHKTGELAVVETFVVEMPAATSSPVSEAATDGASGETKRKRRRGGRRHKKGATEPVVVETASEPVATVVEPARDNAGADEAGGGAKRKRRRGGRKHHKAEPGFPASEAGKAAGDTTQVGTAFVAMAASETSASTAEKKTPRKRAPRRRPAPEVAPED